MNEKTPVRLPIWALLLDIVGTLLLAGGIFGLVADDQLLSSLPFDLSSAAIALIIVGALLMMPLIIVILQRVISRQ